MKYFFLSTQVMLSIKSYWPDIIYFCICKHHIIKLYCSVFIQLALSNSSLCLQRKVLSIISYYFDSKYVSNTAQYLPRHYYFWLSLVSSVKVHLHPCSRLTWQEMWQQGVSVNRWYTQLYFWSKYSYIQLYSKKGKKE